MTRSPLLALAPLLLATAGVVRAGDPTTRAFNEEVQGVWDRLRPVAEQELRRQAGLKVGPLLREPKAEVDLRAIHRIDLDLQRAPGLTDFSDAAITARVPVEGTWRVAAEGDVKVRVKVLGVWLELKRKVSVEVSDLAVSASATFDWSDPTRPKLRSIG